MTEAESTSDVEIISSCNKSINDVCQRDSQQILESKTEQKEDDDSRKIILSNEMNFVKDSESKLCTSDILSQEDAKLENTVASESVKIEDSVSHQNSPEMHPSADKSPDIESMEHSECSKTHLNNMDKSTNLISVNSQNIDNSQDTITTRKDSSAIQATDNLLKATDISICTDDNNSK